jgi:hypothetical protein
MALTAAAKKKISTLLKVKETDLEAALKDEKEVDLTIPEDLEVLTKEELEARDTAQKKLGEKDGREIGIKEVKKAAGLPDDAPSKDPVKVAQAIVDKATADAKVKPDEKVTQLTEQVTLLQKQLGEKDGEVATAKKTAADTLLDRKILAAFPKDRASTLEEEEYLTLIKASYSFKEQDGAIIVEKDGKPLRDTKTTNPLALADAVAGIFNERKWIGEQTQVPGGRGGGNQNPTGKAGKLSELMKQFKDAGKNMQGDEFREAVAAATKDNKDFDMNS